MLPLLLCLSVAICFSTPDEAAKPIPTVSSAAKVAHLNWKQSYNILDASKTYGFWIAQQRSLNHIADSFPTQSRRAKSLLLEMESTFGPGIRALEDNYTDAHSEWRDLHDQVIQQTDSTLSKGFSETDAVSFLDEVDKRLKGELPNRIRETLLTFQPRFISNPSSEFKDGFRAELSTKGNARAKGVELMMQYPMSWSAVEPRRPNIVTTLRSHGGSGDICLMVLVKDIPEDAIEELRTEGVALFADPVIVQNIGGRYVGGGRMQIAAKDVPWTKYFYSQEVVEVHTKILIWSFQFVHHDKYINIQFHISSAAGAPEDLLSDDSMQERFKTYESLFRLMLVSVDFADRFK